MGADPVTGQEPPTRETLYRAMEAAITDYFLSLDAGGGGAIEAMTTVKWVVIAHGYTLETAESTYGMEVFPGAAWHETAGLLRRGVLMSDRVEDV